MPYNKENSGVLFPNDQQGNKNRPAYKGKLNVSGVDYRISAWERKSKAGGQFWSIAVEPKQQAVDRQGDTRVGQPDDEIPFAPEWR